MNYKLVLESAPGQQCTHTEHQPPDEEVKERPGPSTILYLSVLHPWGWTVHGLALTSIRIWGRADPQRNTRVTQHCEAEHKLGKRHIGLRLQQEAGEHSPSTSHESLRQNEMAPNTWESPTHCICPGLMVLKKARQHLVHLDRSETLSSYSRCLETFTCTTENLVQGHHHLDGRLLHKQVLGLKTGAKFSRADCYNHHPPNLLDIFPKCCRLQERRVLRQHLAFTQKL